MWGDALQQMLHQVHTIHLVLSPDSLLSTGPKPGKCQATVSASLPNTPDRNGSRMLVVQTDTFWALYLSSSLVQHTRPPDLFSLTQQLQAATV